MKLIIVHRVTPSADHRCAGCSALMDAGTRALELNFFTITAASQATPEVVGWLCPACIHTATSTPCKP